MKIIAPLALSILVTTSAYAQQTAVLVEHGDHGALEAHVTSAAGPAQGEVAVGLGFTALIVLPAFDARVLYGITANLDLDILLVAGPTGSLGEIGARYCFVQTESFSMAARVVGGGVGVYVDGFDGIAYAKAGMLGSIESSFATFTVGAHVPVETYSRKHGAGFRTGAFETSLAAEFAAVTGANLYLQLTGVIAPDFEDLPFIPFFTIGGSF